MSPVLLIKIKILIRKFFRGYNLSKCHFVHENKISSETRFIVGIYIGRFIYAILFDVVTSRLYFFALVLLSSDLSRSFST